MKHEDRTAEWQSWSGMLTRCSNPKQASYKDYGGRGITVCARWRCGDGERTGFECFLADMGPKPSPAHTLDRRQNDGNYEPGNCRWATRSEQMLNRRPHKRPGAAGEGGSHAKLTWAAVREIRALKGQMSQDKIARRFGVSAGAVGLVLARRTWDVPAVEQALERLALAMAEHEREPLTIEASR